MGRRKKKEPGLPQIRLRVFRIKCACCGKTIEMDSIYDDHGTVSWGYTVQQQQYHRAGSVKTMSRPVDDRFICCTYSCMRALERAGRDYELQRRQEILDWLDAERTRIGREPALPKHMQNGYLTDDDMQLHKQRLEAYFSEVMKKYHRERRNAGKSAS